MYIDLRHKRLLISLACTFIIGSLAITAFVIIQNRNDSTTATQKFGSLVKFNSAEDYKAYLKYATLNTTNSLGAGGMALTTGMLESSAIDSVANSSTPKAAGVLLDQTTNTATRVSTTNNQVLGIDEPDFIKNDSQNIYLANQNYYYTSAMPMIDLAPNAEAGVAPSTGTAITSSTGTVIAPDAITGSTTASGSGSISITSGTGTTIAPSAGVSSSSTTTSKLRKSSTSTINQTITQIIKAFPPDQMAELNKIQKSGQLLLSGNKLMIIGSSAITTYDVTDPKNPIERWTKQFASGIYVSNSRLKDGNIFLVTNNYINQENPCPVQAFTTGTTLACDQIYHPTTPILADTTYQVFKINIDSGEIANSIAFIGSGQSTTFYMSNDNMYISYFLSPDYSKILTNVINENQNSFTKETRDRIAYINTLDISQSSKITEMERAIETSFTNSKDEQGKTELQNLITTYTQAHQRELSQTGIVKVSNSDLQIAATGQVPGQLLNQYSLDEYEGNLRVATTVGSLNFSSSDQSTNDAYVLNSKLENIGQVLDMGKGERIYSVRFIEKQGYIVTFKQTDPFYVLDLADATNPQLKGQLKIPGYSAYLHPLSDTVIAGIGKEENSLKVTLFNVADPANPTELDTMKLDEFGSELMYDSHAFLNDSKHQILFVPGYNKSYIIGYAGNKLSLKTSITSSNYRRAIYLDNYLYLIGNNNIQVIDENNWLEVKNFGLSSLPL